MNSATLGRVIRTALSTAGLDRVGSCFYIDSRELIWVVRPEKDHYSSSWHIRLGIFLKELDRGRLRPDENECHVLFDFLSLSSRVPSSASSGRFGDRASYFAMALDPTHDLIKDDERVEAADFIAHEIVEHGREVSDRGSLERFIGTTAGLLVDKRVREALSTDRG